MGGAKSTPEKKAIIAMSGGVDSSVAAALMLDQGYACEGITLKLGFSSTQDIDDAAAVARRLGISHTTLGYTEEFNEQVIRRFVETYGRGETPNPCIDCNRRIKFNLALLRARQIISIASPPATMPASGMIRQVADFFYARPPMPQKTRAMCCTA